MKKTSINSIYPNLWKMDSWMKCQPKCQKRKQNALDKEVIFC